MRRSFILALIAALLPLAAAQAQTSVWSRMAEEDLAAADRLLRDNHPGAVPEANDATFLKSLASGRAAAGAIAAGATTYGGYRAALQRFAAAFGDAHISSNATLTAQRSWPGFLIEQRGDVWQIIARADDKAPPPGSRLLSCDGRSPDQLAAERIAPFTADWSVASQRVRASRSLLLDSGNPVQPPLQRCTFAAPGGGTAEHKLSWRGIGEDELGKQIGTVIHPAPEEVYLRPFDRGYWVRLGTLSGAAVPLLQQVEAQKAALRSAPYVVVDLRSNGGGASFFTDKLARALYGATRVAEVQKKNALAEDMMVWRATPAALKEAQSYVQRLSRVAPSDDPYLLGLSAQRDAIARALAAGKPLASAPNLVHLAPEPRDAVRPAPRVVLVTDRYCFSSCLMGVRLFRALGAVHLGEETNANTHYSNLRTVTLPSGLSTFSTLQAYQPALPRKMGPFRPDVRYDGDLADDTALQERVRLLLAAPK
jgi:hypothetical protein